MQCIKWTCDTFGTFETKQCLLSPPELCRPRELFFAHANVLEMQTRAGYGEVGIFINSTKRKPSWQALQPKGLVHQPIKQPALVYSRSSIEFMQCYYCSMFLPKFNVRLCIAVPHAAKSRNHVVRVCSLHCSTLLPTPPVRVLDTSSLLCYMLCLFTRCSSCFHTRLHATIVFPFLRESWRPSECTLKGNLHIYVAANFILYKRCCSRYCM